MYVDHSFHHCNVYLISFNLRYALHYNELFVEIKEPDVYDTFWEV